MMNDVAPVLKHSQNEPAAVISSLPAQAGNLACSADASQGSAKP